MGSQLAKQKLRIMWREEARLREQAQREKETQQFHSFCEVSDRIRTLRHKLKNEDDEDNIEDMKEEIEMLKD